MKQHGMMAVRTVSLFASLLLLTQCVVARHSFVPRSSVSSSLQARNPTGNFNQLYLASNYQNGSTAPGAAAGNNAGQTVVVGGTGADDDSQNPTCPTIFINTAAVNGSMDTGWTEIPNVLGFYTDRNLTYGTSTMPTFIETKDFSLVKRVIIAQPGKPRDSWKYSNLFRNALICAVSNASMPVTLEDVLVVAPVWLDDDDHNAGAGEATDVYWSNGGWNVGSKSIGPDTTDVSSFQILDDLVTRFANATEFPQVNSIFVAGHSLGGSIAQRYAMLRNQDSDTEPFVQYWVGNPGAYVWPSADRPVTPSDTSCAAQVDDWAYGVSGTLPAYVKGKPSAADIYARYRNRTMQYALGLADDGPGDTHCEAQYQGDSHLSRGQNMQKALQAMQGGMPVNQTFNYVPNTSHEDYLMMSDINSQLFLYVDDLNNSRPVVTASSGSGSGSGGKKSSKSGNSSSSSTSSDGTPSYRLSALTSVFFAVALFAVTTIISI